MIKDSKLLIDQDCPMCRAYGYCFVKTGMMEPEVLTTYQHTQGPFTEKIDMDRARNEIALYDEKAQETRYGIDAMIGIVTYNRPVLDKILHLKLIHAILLRIYRFITYNRKVIYPVAEPFTGRACVPDFNLKYRWVYILFVAFFTGFILNKLAFHLNTAFGFVHNDLREYLICFGQIGWQLAVVSILHKPKSIEYLGNMSTVSLIGAILLIPLLVLNQYFPFPGWGLIAYFMAVVGLMFVEHIRRCRLLGLSIWMTVSWVVYRMCVLLVIWVLI